MRKEYLLFTFVFVIIGCVEGDDSRGVNGGMNCAVCTIITGIIQQRGFLEGITLFSSARKLCKKLPIKIQKPCFETISELEPLLLNKKFLTLFTPDAFCYAIRSCHIDPGEKFCHVFPRPHLSFRKTQDELTSLLIRYDAYNILHSLQTPENSEINLIKNGAEYFSFKRKNVDKKLYKQKEIEVDFCKIPIISIFCKLFLGTLGKLTPMIDIDKDGFSSFRVARGSDWRGKDCSDIDSSIYPGAQPQDSDAFLDGNCNGIWGIDPESQRPWEDILCDGTEARGLIYLGDSIGAHFHLPESWMNPFMKDLGSIATIIEIILDEGDWPELGFATGFVNTTSNLIDGFTDSLYLRLRANNLCSHRNYQNGARNAAMSWDGMNEANAISKKKSDQPALVIYAMMGNDVCNRFRDTINNMTKPDQFHKLVMGTLEILDEKLPLNSNVVLVSLINASFIYPSMAERIHPMGTVLNNIRYKDVYSWWSCMQIGPCEGWMNSNATLREITTQKAIELSKVLEMIAKTSNFKSFKVHYLQNPFNKVIDNWVSQGKHVYELIDPIDSTHPNQKAQPLMAEAMWESLQKIGVIGRENPNNAKILKIFGNQGGH